MEHPVLPTARTHCLLFTAIFNLGSARRKFPLQSCHMNKELIYPLNLRCCLFYFYRSQGSVCSHKQKQTVSGENHWCEIVYLLVSKFRCHKEKSCLQHTHGSSYRNSVKVFQSNLSNLKAEEDMNLLARY